MQNERELPFFNVIIPQKNRAEYIGHTLKTCMIQDYPSFRIIVSDDCSDDDSVNVIRALSKQDPRIELYAHDHHLGMRENFEFALNQVKSGFVIALGGDDGLLPGCIWRMYEILKETGQQLLTWPLANFIYPIQEGGKNLLYVKHVKKQIRILKSKDFLEKISNTFLYQIDECPMFYMKGVASMDLINRVKFRSKDNCFYHCPTPDGFSGVVLAGEVEEYAFTTEPLSIGGTTMKSQGANYMRTDEKSKAEAQQFFNDNIRVTMHKELASQPYSPLVTLMTADYLLTAKDLPGWPGSFKGISYENLLRQSFNYISRSAFESEPLKRELSILKKIAEQHDLLPLFEHLNKNTKKIKVVHRDIFFFAITHSVRFEGTSLGIHNIYDASLVTNFIYNCCNEISFGGFLRFIKHTLEIMLPKTLFGKKESLPIV